MVSLLVCGLVYFVGFGFALCLVLGLALGCGLAACNCLGGYCHFGVCGVLFVWWTWLLVGVCLRMVVDLLDVDVMLGLFIVDCCVDLGL